MKKGAFAPFPFGVITIFDAAPVFVSPLTPVLKSL